MPWPPDSMWKVMVYCESPEVCGQRFGAIDRLGIDVANATIDIACGVASRTMLLIQFSCLCSTRPIPGHKATYERTVMVGCHSTQLVLMTRTRLARHAGGGMQHHHGQAWPEDLLEMIAITLAPRGSAGMPPIAMPSALRTLMCWMLMKCLATADVKDAQVPILIGNAADGLRPSRSSRTRFTAMRRDRTRSSPTRMGSDMSRVVMVTSPSRLQRGQDEPHQAAIFKAGERSMAGIPES